VLYHKSQWKSLINNKEIQTQKRSKNGEAKGNENNHFETIRLNFLLNGWQYWSYDLSKKNKSLVLQLLDLVYSVWSIDNADKTTGPQIKESGSKEQKSPIT